MNQYHRDMDGALTLAPKESLKKEMLLDDKERPVRLLFLGRANTDGDLVAWLPRQRLVATGDVVVAPSPYGFRSFPKDWIKVLSRLKALKPLLLVPGHGPAQRDTSYVDRMIALVKDVRRQVRPLVAAGATIEEIQRKVDLTAHKRQLVGDDPWKGRWFDAYWKQPIVVSAYKEAKGEPIEQSLSG